MCIYIYPVLVDNDTTENDITRVDTEEVPQTVPAADCPGDRELNDMHPRRSHREKYNVQGDRTCNLD